LLPNAAHLSRIVGLGGPAIHSARVRNRSVSASNLAHLPDPFFAVPINVFFFEALPLPPSLSLVPLGGNPFTPGASPLWVFGGKPLNMNDPFVT
jgi:hypothetical protein